MDILNDVEKDKACRVNKSNNTFYSIISNKKVNLIAHFLDNISYSIPHVVHVYTGVWVNPFCAGIGFIRQNLTSGDVRFLRIKPIPALKELTYLYWS